MSADEKLDYPFYVMIRDKQLLKVHGSSIVSKLRDKPKWACCQNMIVSKVTGRPMTRVLVPIKESLLSELYILDHKKALKMDQQKLSQRLTDTQIPSAVLKYLRSKNHNEYIQKMLVEEMAYLETDEDNETILFFYIKDIDKEKEKNERMLTLRQNVMQHVQDLIKKRHYLFPLSDRTKMQIDSNGDAVDILSSTEFISFIVRYVSENCKAFLKDSCVLLKIP